MRGLPLRVVFRNGAVRAVIAVTWCETVLTLEAAACTGFCVIFLVALLRKLRTTVFSNTYRVCGDHRRYLPMAT